MGTDECPGILKVTVAIREVVKLVDATNICINYSFEHYDRIKWLVEKIRDGDTSFLHFIKKKTNQQTKKPIPQLFYFCEVMHQMNNREKIQTIEAKVRGPGLNTERSTTEKNYSQFKSWIN